MIGVVGGTLAGLAAAIRLVRRGHDVRVFEASDELGGFAAATATDATDGEPLERVPVSFARPRDEPAFELLTELGLQDRLEWSPVRTAIYADGTVHPVDTPWEFLAYPPLSLSDTARLALVQSGIDGRGLPRRRPRSGAYDPGEYATVPAEQFLREHTTDAVYETFYEPLLEARFGPHAPTVSASWVLEHCRGERERTRFGRERRGTLAGSTAVLVEALVDAIGRERVVTSARVRSLECTDGAVESIAVERDGETERHAVDAVVLATDPDRLEVLTGHRPSVPIRTRTCVRVSTTAETPLTDAYRVTMADDAPFRELVTHTALRSPDRYGGHQYYLLDGGDAVDGGHSSATVERRWLEALADRFPAFDRNELAGVETTRIHQPVPEAGVSNPLESGPAALSTSVGDGVYDAGITRHAQFPERGVGGALEAGLSCGSRVANDVRRISKRRSASH